MTRRIHVPALSIGDIPLEAAQAHHARDVLRLAEGTEVDVFDNAGATAAGVLLHFGPQKACVRITAVDAPAATSTLQWTIAAAVPKGDRADWMMEKLSELGTAAFIPLAATRSVALPEGKGKRDRWLRLATEAAKQSRRIGVMRIDELTSVATAVRNVVASSANAPHASPAWFCTTEVPGKSIPEMLAESPDAMSLMIFIGPEGGWTPDEVQAFIAAGMAPVRLGETILRIETAAIVASAIVSSQPRLLKPRAASNR